jgi:integrase
MPYDDVARFVSNLREREGIAPLALEFCVLTAARSGEVLGLRWSEIDFGRAVWTVPAARMKAGREHRVPLSGRAIAILKGLAASNQGEYAFAGRRLNRPLSSMAMEMMLRRMNVTDATVHGFRSAFRDWAGNVSTFPREIIETALSHVVGDQAEQAYRRSDALEKRRNLMEAWAIYCEGTADNTVIQLKQVEHPMTPVPILTQL